MYRGQQGPKVTMSVRMDRTPRPKKKTKATGKSKKQASDDLGPSTILTSPLQPQAKRSRKGRAPVEDFVDEEDDFAVSRNGYRINGFVVDEDDDDDDCFDPPAAKAKAAPRAAARQGGSRITSDMTMESLSPNRKIYAEGLQQELSNFCRNDIMFKNKLRQQPFSDTILREIAIHCPMTVEEMAKIPNINIDMVTRHGQKLLKMIRSSKSLYESTQPAPKDRNHELQVRIDLTNDADLQNSEGEDDEYGSVDDDDAVEESTHFKHTGSSNKRNADIEVQRFNEIMGAPSKPSPATQIQSKPSYGDGRSWKKKYTKARAGSGTQSKKRTSAKAATNSRAPPKSGGSGSGFIGGASSGKGIRAMD